MLASNYVSLALLPLGAARADFVRVLIFVIGIAVFVAIAAGRRWYEKKRTERFSNLADELGLGFVAKGHRVPCPPDGFDLLLRGRRSKVVNAIHGEANGVKLVVFDYQYTVGTGKNASTYRQTAIAISSPELALPPFLFRPRPSFLSIPILGGKKRFAHKDIKLDGGSSKQFMISGDDEEEVKELLRGKLESLMQGDGALTIEGAGEHLLIYKHKHRVRPDEIKPLMQRAFEIYAALRS